MSKSERQIQAAVKNCLARCYQGDTPLGVIGECIGELQAKGWSKTDIHKVEAAVRRVLAGVMGSDDEPDPV